MGLNAIIDLLLNSAQFDSALNKSEQRIKGFAREAEKAGKIAGKIGTGLSLANVAGLDKLAQSSKMARAGIEGLTGAMLLLGAVPLPIAIGVAAVGALAAFALNADNAAEKVEKMRERLIALTQTAEEARDKSRTAAKADAEAQIASIEADIARLESIRSARQRSKLGTGGYDERIAAQRAVLTALQADYIKFNERITAENAAREKSAAERLGADKLAIQQKYLAAQERLAREKFDRQQAFEEAVYRAGTDGDNKPKEAIESLSVSWTNVSDDAAEAMDKMSTYADQAARNMQSAFANFLFDPFAEGLDGLLKGFLQVIQRMIAEVASAQIFEALGFSGKGNPLSGVLGSLFGGGKASGGPVSAGKGYIVGEKGPEWFQPGTSGTIVPNHAMGGGVNITMNVDARNSTDPAAIFAAVQVARQQMRGDVATMLRRGHFP